MPYIGVDGVGHGAVIVIQVGKNCELDRESVGSQQIACALSLGNGKEFVVVSDVNGNWDFPSRPLQNPVVVGRESSQ